MPGAQVLSAFQSESNSGRSLFFPCGSWVRPAVRQWWQEACPSSNERRDFQRLQYATLSVGACLALEVILPLVGVVGICKRTVTSIWWWRSTDSCALLFGIHHDRRRSDCRHPLSNHNKIQGPSISEILNQATESIDAKENEHEACCGICLEAVDSTSSEAAKECRRTKRCRHAFHTKCLEQWLEYASKNTQESYSAQDEACVALPRAASCPVCRTIIA